MELKSLKTAIMWQLMSNNLNIGEKAFNVIQQDKVLNNSKELEKEKSKTAEKQEQKTFKAAVRCKHCTDRLKVTIPDPVLMKAKELSQPQNKGKFRTFSNLACPDCRQHKRYMENIPEYAALFCKKSEEAEELLVYLLKNPPGPFKEYLAAMKLLKQG